MKNQILRVLVSLALLLVCTVQSQEKYEPTSENLENRIWFQDAKFGMFVHWGVYSVLGGGGDTGIAEWIMQNKKIPISQYEKVPDFFNPIDFDAEEWVTMVKNAGMKYITITSKHHDGFAMYDSKVSDYNIVDKTPYGKDVIKILAKESRRQGIKLFFYYSQLDWHHPDYFPRGKTGQGFTGREEKGDWDAYLNFMNTQLNELLTNYGPIGGIWFDGMWDKIDENWQLDKTYKLIHELQPGTLIGSNHHVKPFPGEDFQMFEQDLPGENTTGWQGSHISELPLEMCLTINGSWGFNLIDQKHKTPKELVHMLVKAAGRNANLLLNVGPMPNGKIQPEHKASLDAMGKWMEINGETIYGTRAGIIGAEDWGVSTQKGKKLYIHILDWKKEALLIQPFDQKIRDIKFYNDKSKVQYKLNEYGLLLKLPKGKRTDFDTIIEITLK
ncbi:alpha-L-fucosidase [Maribacter sp. HTCC2170]|uniref:alpha-L-fucosidase n=1 Tax=Maribacter sp. (strain HTCC2170 / KCCM 42371) TaxID=313603 RepID=UPI00006BD56F|nr:alpha-L-fucosidase [Maribacter sp. HTCC2170]EAR02616.1 putative exported alpha-L-fucosidase protein [Maribacter sp. HTCC2170]